MINNITNDRGFVRGEVTLPLFKNSATVRLESSLSGEIAFAERQLELLCNLPAYAYEKLCRHTVDYAAETVDYVAEYLGMFDDEDFSEEILPGVRSGDYSYLASLLDRWFGPQDIRRIMRKFDARNFAGQSIDRGQILRLIGGIVRDLELYQDNFHHIWPVVQEELEANPLQILRYVQLKSVGFERLMENGREVLAAQLDLDCGWEPEHGLGWAIVKTTGVYVGSASVIPELHSLNFDDYDGLHNYCFHKTIY